MHLFLSADFFKINLFDFFHEHYLSKQETNYSVLIFHIIDVWRILQ